MQTQRLVLFIILTFILYCPGCRFLPGRNVKPAKLVSDPEELTLDFDWISLRKGKSVDSLGAMIIPVKIKGCDYQFYMQFDLGHPTTVLYKCVIDEVNNKFKKIQYDTSDRKYFVSNISLKVNNTDISYKQLEAINCKVSSIDWRDTTQKLMIGTIGSDIIENKIIAIAYPARTIRIFKEMPKKMEKEFVFGKMQYKDRRILLTAIIDNKERNIFYDNGSSMFQLATSKEEWERLADRDSSEKTYELSNWGKNWTVHSIATKETITFSNKTLPIGHVQYLDGPSAMLQMMYKLAGIGGMTGNKLFLNSTLIIDTKNLRFGIK